MLYQILPYKMKFSQKRIVSTSRYTKYDTHTICKFILTSRMGHNVCMTSQIIRLLLRLVLLCRCCIILRYLFAPFYSYSSSFLTCLSCPFSFYTLFQNPFIYSRLNVSIHTIITKLRRKYFVGPILNLSRITIISSLIMLD